MQQGKIIVRMCLLMGLDRLRELSHHRVKGLLLVEPMGKHMHADTGQMGRHLNQLPLRLRFFFESLLGVVALALD